MLTPVVHKQHTMRCTFYGVSVKAGGTGGTGGTGGSQICKIMAAELTPRDKSCCIIRILEEYGFLWVLDIFPLRPGHRLMKGRLTDSLSVWYSFFLSECRRTDWRSVIHVVPIQIGTKSSGPILSLCVACQGYMYIVANNYSYPEQTGSINGREFSFIRSIMICPAWINH